jgi:hybrid cluster-associated redox disulfide protein
MLRGDESIAEVLQRYPKTEKVLADHFKSMCLHCPMSTLETLEQGAEAHGIKIEDLLKDLDKVIKKGE